MKERILDFLRHENKTSSQFADEIGVQPSSVSHIISGRNKPSLDFVIKMLQQYGDLSTDWLIFGRGEMFKPDSANNLFTVLDNNNMSESSTVKEDNTLQTPVKELFNQIEGGLSDTQPDKKVSIQKLVLIYSDNSFKEYKPG